jgi:hypothetical protein
MPDILSEPRECLLGAFVTPLLMGKLQEPQKHPYLQTSKPEPITVGGVEGVQFEILVENLPEDHHGVCGSDCVDLARLSSGSQTFLGEGYKLRLIDFEDMKGETVNIGFASPASEFDEFAPKAQRVLDSVKWRGS